MKSLKILAIILTGLLLLFAASASKAIDADESSGADLDHVVAVVDDDVITRAELDQELIRVMAQLRERNVNVPTQDVLERQVLERMIIKHIQLQVAERLGIQIDDATLDRAIESIASKNGLSLEQLRDKLESDGMNFAKFREDTRQQLLIMRLQTQEVVNRVNISDQEIESFIHQNSAQISGIEAVHLQHILIAIPDGATPDVIQNAKDKVERVLKQLRAGADFAQTAMVVSDGRQALDGGDLGWMPLSQVPTIATEAVRTLKPGEISEPLRSASGFHLFRIAEVKGGGNQQVVNQTHARHILIKTNELVSDQDAQTRLAQLRMRILGGESFDALARAHSDDTASAIKGGDLGWVSPGDTVPEFEEQMANLNPKEISQPFHTPFGWHLLQVLERRQHDSTEDTLKAKARESLRSRKAEEDLDLFLRRLRDESYVEIKLNS